MGVMVQIRNVPEPLHRTLKARAALAGQSLSDYLLAEMRRSAEAPSREELVQRLRTLPPLEDLEDGAAAVREVRRERDSGRGSPPGRKRRRG
jgi:plasmid stability protein